MFADGRSYCLGSINRDCWYLYTFSKSENKQNSIHEKFECDINPKPDQTIEILMRDLDCEIMSMFSKENTSSAAEATLVSIPLI